MDENLSVRKLELEERRIDEEIKLKRLEIELQREQFEAIKKSKGFWAQVFSPVGVAVIVGLLTLIGTAASSLINAHIENKRHEAALTLENKKQEANLILKMTEIQDEKQRASNLLFYAQLGYLTFSKEYIAFLREKAALQAGEQVPPPISPSIGMNINKDKPLGENFKITVVDKDSKPIKSSELLVIFPDGTHLKGVTDADGQVRMENLKSQNVTIFCAHKNHTAFFKENHNAQSDLLIVLNSISRKGSIIIIGTGYIPELKGRLNPIIDNSHRMYLYADNISIENGKQQPAKFELNVPFEVEDSDGKKFELKILSIIARSSLIEYSRLN